METHDCRISVVSQYQENPVPHPIRVDIWGVSCWNRAESEDLLTLFVAVEVFDAANRPPACSVSWGRGCSWGPAWPRSCQTDPDDPSVSNMIKPDTSSVSPMSLQLAIKSHIVATLSRARQPVMQGRWSNVSSQDRVARSASSTTQHRRRVFPVHPSWHCHKRPERKAGKRQGKPKLWISCVEPLKVEITGALRFLYSTLNSWLSWPWLGAPRVKIRQALAEENFMWDTNMLLLFKYTNTLHSNHIISIHCLPTAAFGNWFYFVCPDLQVATGCHCNQSAVALEVLLGLPWEWWQDKVRVFWCFLTGLHFVSCPLVN